VQAALVGGAEALLARQRHPLPSDWLQSSRVAAALSGVTQALTRREAAVEASLPALRARVTTEGAAVAQRAAALAAAWASERPIAGASAVVPCRSWVLKTLHARPGKLAAPDPTMQLHSAKPELN
jgi:hypothetical protein